MGLRFTLILIVSAVLALSGAGMVLVFRHQLAAEAAAADRSGAHKDMDRLLLALNQQVAELDVVLGSWANYTSFYEHAAKPNAAFRRDELSADALAAAHFDWLNLVNDHGQILEHGEVPQPDGSTPARRAFEHPAMAAVVNVALHDMVKREKGCAILSDGQRLAIGCYRPLLTTDSKGPSRGTVLIGRWISESMLSAVKAQTGLQFSIVMQAQAMQAPADPSRVVGGFHSSDFRLTEETDRIWAESTVWGMHGRQIARVQMNWPRESPQRTVATLRFVTIAMATFIAITAMVLVLACDHLLARRLRGIRSDLGHILMRENWDGTVASSRRDELTELAHYINDMLNIIRDKIALVQEQALTDPLTGLPNRRRFDMRMASTLSQFQRDGRVGALVLFDIDNFKRYNDAYGHPQGDEVLVQFALCLREAARRPVDMPARLGGEEFAILMPLTDRDGARHCAENARAAMQALAIAHTGNEPSGVVTVSAGMAIIGPDDSAESLYSRADAALYAAKHAGRNRLAFG